MSGDYYRPNGGMRHQRGLKRTYNDRGDATGYSAYDNLSRLPYYSNSWIPPGNLPKRLGSHELNNYMYIPNKIPRTENSRSYSTSSVPLSSSSAPSPAYSRIPPPHLQRTVTKGQRSMSSSSSSSPAALPAPAATRGTADSRIKVTVQNGVNSERRTSSTSGTGTDSSKHKSNRDEIDKSDKSRKEVDSGATKRRVSSPSLSKKGSHSEAGPSSTKKNSRDFLNSQEMSRRVWGYYVANKQSKVEENVKEEMRKKLQACIKEIYPNALLLLGGSSMNGFGSTGCDADMCLYLSDSLISQKDARHILLTLRGYLQNRCSFVKNMKVIFAKVPILKFQHKIFRDLECDLNINHHTGVRNTALLQTYSELDWRVSPLVMIIKQWAKNHGINDASQGTLSSYSYVLMIINYLQVGCKPPVVESIQKQEWGRTVFSDHQSVLYSWNRLFEYPVKFITDPHNQSKNSQDLYSLLKGFFEYYANFDFENTVISIRLGSCFPCNLLPPNHQGWRQKYIFIEEPFDRINTARSVFDWSRYRQILEAFEETHDSLCKTNELDIQSFLNLR
ncbi:poly(A) RNA polymerase GLD2-like [Lytechinus variegatus]|uniref:poly(A) RNA polymerase GLD2-like n=1 Tax=Lytechinus variegatus TaxID=7654 RepID=UPI001BB15035|nr:poly(A) RNA polymerase GLD2-like [Lytechinus variegatus]XP_041464208.1 poly(A) RNA polymerase GLD2-like [Lytechinus variegatus]